MNIHKASEWLKKVFGFSVAIAAATTNGASADCLGFEKAMATVYAAPTGSGTTADAKLQESADNSSFADVAGGAFTQVTTAGGAKYYVMDVDLAKRLRYLRIVFTGAGGSAAGTAYGEITLLVARNAPVSQANTALSV